MTKKQLTRALKRIAAKYAQIPKPLHVWKWAEEKRVLPAGVTAKSGPYRVRQTPYMQEPQEAYFNPDVQVTVLCMASRLGKTEGEMNLTGYTIDHDPCHILWVYPTQDSAKKWKKEFFNPMIENSKCFAGKIKSPRSRDGDNTMFSIGFPGGRVSAIGANSPSAFRQIQAPRVICEEVDAMESTVEGDPILLAFKRADNYRESVQVISSTPTIKGASRVWDWLEKSDFRKWHCPCPHCAKEFVMMWQDLKMDEGAPETARIECPECHAAINDDERRAMISAGRWVATKPFSGVRGYWLNGLNSLMPPKRGFANKLHQFAVDFLTAHKTGPDAIKTWMNTFLAECYEEQVQAVAVDAIKGRDEEYEVTPLPDGVLVLTAAVDLQLDRLEIEFAGWGRDEERWGLGKFVLSGDPKLDDGLWDRLDALLLTEFQSAGGAPLKIERALIDMGFANQRVLGFCAPRINRGIYPCRGLNRVGLTPPPLLPPAPSRNNRARIPHWNIGVTVAKQTLYDRLVLPTPGPRSMHFPKGNGYDEDHFRQLTAEKLKKRFSYGQAYFIFEKDNTAVRNEAMDLWVYSYAALQTLYPLSWDAREVTLRRKEEQAAIPRPADGQPARQPLRRGSWATKW